MRDGLTPRLQRRVPGSDRTITTGEDWPPGLYLVLLDDAAPTAWFVVPRCGGDRARAGDQHLERATTTSTARTSTPAPSRCRSPARWRPGCWPRPTTRRAVGRRGYGRATRDQELTSWHGMAGWARLGAAVHAVGRARRLRASAYATNADLEEHPEVLDGVPAATCRVGHDEYWTWGDARHGRGVHRRRRQRRVLLRQHVLWQVRIEGDDRVMVGYKDRFAEDPLSAPTRGARRRSGPIRRRPAREPHDRRVVHPRRLPPHRPQRRRTAPAATRSTAPTTGSSTAPARLRRRARRRRDRRRLRVRRLRADLRRGLPTGPPGFEVVATAPATPSTSARRRCLAGRPLRAGLPCRRLDVDSRGPAPRPRRPRPVPDGGTVVTAGCTDWAYGLDDPAVDRVTRNIVERLG